jgi:hypothetical protein
VRASYIVARRNATTATASAAIARKSTRRLIATIPIPPQVSSEHRHLIAVLRPVVARGRIGTTAVHGGAARP